MYKKEDLIKTPEYILDTTQNELFRMVDEYMEKHNLNESQLAKEWGVSKRYVSKVLEGNFDSSLSEFIKLVLAVDKIPIIKFKNK